MWGRGDSVCRKNIGNWTRSQGRNTDTESFQKSPFLCQPWRSGVGAVSSEQGDWSLLDKIIIQPRPLLCFVLLVTKSCLFCNPMDCSPPGSSVLGIFQARVLGWAAISSCRGSSWPRDPTSIPCICRQIL